MEAFFDGLPDLGMPLVEGGLCIGAILLAVLIGLGLIRAAYSVFTRPLRRREHARHFLDLVQTAQETGQGIEPSLVAMAECGDPSLTKEFQQLAVQLRGGRPLDQALDRVPDLLPPQLTAMLKAGVRLNAIAKVLPAGRRLLDDSLSLTRGALNYLIFLACFVTPALPILFLVVRIYIFPQFYCVAAEMTGPEESLGFLDEMMRVTGWLALLQIVLLLGIGLLVVGYALGPGSRLWRIKLLRNCRDQLAMGLPWRRKRLQRDFVSVLGVLLDHQVPEAQAIQLAAESTANGILLRRAALAIQRLEQGLGLVTALRTIDPSDEFDWRMDNARRSAGGFTAALEGWIEALEAKAFQQEQGAAQLATTGLVLVNGVTAGLLTFSIYLFLLTLIEEGLLW